MLTDLWTSADHRTVLGLSLLAVLLYWVHRVEGRPKRLPPPVDKTVCDKEMRAWMGRR